MKPLLTAAIRPPFFFLSSHSLYMQVIFQDYYTLPDLIKVYRDEYSSHTMAASV